MKYELLSNTLTFVRQHKDPTNVLRRLISQMEQVPNMPNFRVLGPLRTRVLHQQSFKLVFTDEKAARTALEWIERNFKVNPG